MYFYLVPVTFALCTVLFLCSFHFTGASVETSCSRVSFFHHVVALILGLWAHWTYREQVEEHASFGQNHHFPIAVALQHFNLGYFFYDLIHVTVWDQKWILHHVVALAGYSTSELANVFGLANAVNTWITEVGSLMYSAYLIIRSDTAYTVFVVFYSVSRLYFVVWSCTVFKQVWKELSAPPASPHYPFWAPYDAALLQILLLGVNIVFLSTHVKKLWKKLRGGKTNGHSNGKSDGKTNGSTNGHKARMD